MVKNERLLVEGLDQDWKRTSLVVDTVNIAAAAAVARAEMRERIARYLEDRAQRQIELGEPDGDGVVWAWESAAKDVRKMEVL